MACKDYKQGDNRWRNKRYAANSMAAAGCGPTACADVIASLKENVTPVQTADWLTAHGYAVAHNGTSWFGIAPCCDAFSLDGTQLNGANLYGKKDSSYEKEWKSLMASGKYYGILLMGPGKFTKGGHFICITQWDGRRAYVYDPASYSRNGWHPWSDFAGNVKVFYVVKRKDSAGGDVSEKVANIKAGQTQANSFAGSRLAVDGKRGPLTKAGGIKVLQHAMNLDYEAGLAEDGKFGPKSDAALKGHSVCKGERQYMVTALEILLMLRGYDPKGVETPGHFGNGLEAAVRQYQKDNGLTIDGIAGYKTFKSMIA